MSELAAIVQTTDVEQVLSLCSQHDRLDRSRRIVSYGEDAVAIPVTARFDHPAIDCFREDVAPLTRPKTVQEHLAQKGWSADELETVPRSYARIGDLLVVDGPIRYRPSSVGRSLMAIHRDVAAVYEQRDIAGAKRRPRLKHVVGEHRTHTVHREHGIEFELDLAEVMFSPGNQRERRYMRTITKPGERVLDLCAGIGYFAVPCAVGGGRVTAIERNPASFRFLSRNASRNGVSTRLRPILGDCRGSTIAADRVLVGHLPVHDCRSDPRGFGEAYLDSALRALPDGGTVHVHAISYADAHDCASSSLYDRITRRGRRVQDITSRQIKSIAPRTDHLVIDVTLAPDA